jgi:hypothetical protein
MTEIGYPAMCEQTPVKQQGTVFTSTRADSGRFVECAFCDMAPENVSMRRSRAELDITAGFESLRRAIMTTAQFLALAPAPARQLGIDLKDGEQGPGCSFS